MATQQQIHDALAKYAQATMDPNGLAKILTEHEYVATVRKMTDGIIEHLEIPITFNCDTCKDTGEVDTMEQVYPDEPHTAPIGTGRCPECTGDTDDDAELDQDR